MCPHLIKKVVGGLSDMLRHIFHLVTDGAIAMCSVGVPLALHGGVLALFAKIAIVLIDPDGQRQNFDWKCACSTSPCMCCNNVRMKGHPCMDGHVDICCTDDRLFRRMEQETLLGFVGVVAGAHASMVAPQIT